MDESLSELDQMLLLLMSAFDITARVAHGVLGIQMDRRGVGWQQKRWLKEVSHSYRPLYDVAMSRAFKGVPALVFSISKLRNLVHGPGLVPGGTIPVVGDRALEIFAALPNEDARQIEGALVRVATGIDWGLRKPHEGNGLHLQPGTFAERVLTFALPLLNELMQNTVPLKHAEAERKPLTADEWITPFDARRLWQLGIEPVSRVSDF